MTVGKPWPVAAAPIAAAGPGLLGIRRLAAGSRTRPVSAVGTVIGTVGLPVGTAVAVVGIEAGPADGIAAAAAGAVV